ncbi:MAG: response regulator [Verrucomicrobiales bacterium]|nr:response regulator [Verrucomicrobiales bacterium]
MPTILIVDDEEDLRDLVAQRLEREGFKTLHAADGLTGQKLATKKKPDLIVLDLMMPGKDGITVCRDLRKDSRTSKIPILMLTARSGLDEKITGLELGADDFMTKPFSPKELVLRVRNILRRTLSIDAGSTVEVGEFRLDKNSLKLHLAGEEVDLTSTEFKLLLSLIEAPGTVRERGELLQQVWGYSEQIQTRTLDTHIKRLRAKLGDFGSCVETVRSVGYRFVGPSDQPEG